MLLLPPLDHVTIQRHFRSLAEPMGLMGKQIKHKGVWF